MEIVPGTEPGMAYCKPNINLVDQYYKYVLLCTIVIISNRLLQYNCLN